MYDKILGKAAERFGVQPMSTTAMEDVIEKCMNIYTGEPPWLSEDIKTINFAKSVASEIARLTTLAIGIQIDGGGKGEWLQKQVDRMYFQLRHWVEFGCAYGTIILKPNGTDVDVYTPNEFIVTDSNADRIIGGIFVNKAQDGKKFYTRLEYHRFEGDQYLITNSCYVSDKENDEGRAVAIENTPWAGLKEEYPGTLVCKMEKHYEYQDQPAQADHGQEGKDDIQKPFEEIPIHL